MKVLAFPAFKNKKSNPYNYLLYKDFKGAEIFEFSFGKALRFNYDIIHIHWPEWYLNSNYFLKAASYSFLLIVILLVAKCFGIKVVWTIHNLKPHEIKYRFLNKIFWRVYPKLVDGIISLSDANEKIAVKFHSIKDNVSRATIYHGLYTEIYNNNIKSNEAKELLNINKKDRVCLFLGQVKKYKNVDELVKVFTSGGGLNKYTLIIAGKFESEEYYKETLELIGDNENILLYNKFISDDDLQVFFNAADLSVLPFKDIFNSGSALLSLTFNTSVLLPESENFLEYGRLIKNTKIYTYKESLTQASILEAIEGNSNDSNFINDNINNEELKWSELQKKLLNYYKIVWNKI